MWDLSLLLFQAVIERYKRVSLGNMDKNCRWPLNHCERDEVLEVLCDSFELFPKRRRCTTHQG